MFDEGMCFHATDRTWVQEAQQHEQQSPGDYFGPLAYPRELLPGLLTVRAAWLDLQRASRYSSGPLPCLLAAPPRSLSLPQAASNPFSAQ
jgi:hypothetical protein